MPLMKATGYIMGFLLFLVVNSIFTLEDIVITISFLPLGYSQIACARTLGLVGTTVSKYYVTCGMHSRMLLNADGNSTNTVIQFTAMCLLLSIARMRQCSHLRTR